MVCAALSALISLLNSTGRADHSDDAETEGAKPFTTVRSSITEMPGNTLIVDDSLAAKDNKRIALHCATCSRPGACHCLAGKGTHEAVRACSTNGRCMVLNAMAGYLLAGTPGVLFPQKNRGVGEIFARRGWEMLHT